MQDEHANHGVRNQQRHFFILRAQPREHAAHRGAHFRGIDQIRFRRGRENRSRRQAARPQIRPEPIPVRVQRAAAT